jgi:F-type H+-transporting ATPase subunit gamma
MAKAREIKRRIRSVRSTQQITKTMEMVSTSKLKKAQTKLLEARPYNKALKEMTAELLQGLGGRSVNPLMKSYKEIESVIVLLITSNRGLCGAFNNNLIRLCRETIDVYREKGVETRLFISGKKGMSYFRYLQYPIEESYTELSDLPTVEGLSPLADILIEEFTSGKAQEVHIIYSTFHSVMSQKPVQERILPIREDQAAGVELPEEDKYIIEPSAESILESLLPAFVRNMVYQAFLETHTSEHGARRTAMKSASENADDMIKTLTRWYNRARQAQITQELAEIVSGAEALKG